MNRAVPRSIRPDHVAWVSLAALLLATVVTILLASARREVYDALRYRNYFQDVEVEKSAGYYLFFALGSAAALSAGLLAFRMRKPGGARDRRFLVAFFLFQAAGIAMTARGYSAEELLTTRLAGSTGPFICLISFFLFVGTRRRNWRILSVSFLVLSAFFAARVLAGMARLPTGDRFEAVEYLHQDMTVLYWLAAWAILAPWTGPARLRPVRWVPLAVYSAATVLVQTRLNVVMILALVVAKLLVSRRRGEETGHRFPVAITTVFLALAFAWWLQGTLLGAMWTGSLGEFQERLDEDTRTGQIVSFFMDVDPSELILGRGSQATWMWNGISWGGGTDIGFLSLLFYGGIPLLATYLAVHLWPAYYAIRSGSRSTELSCSAIVALWGLRMFFSSFPSLYLEYLVVLLCVGGCLAGPRENAV